MKYAFDACIERRGTGSTKWDNLGMRVSNTHAFPSEEELLRIGDICEKYGVLLVSDEIHGDIIFGGRRHVPAGSLDRPWAAKTITCVSPSKTFNIAGLEAAAVIVRDEAVRGALRAKLQAMHIDVPNAFAMAGYCAAYTECEDYLEQELAYLRGNIRFVADTFCQSMPKLHLVEPEGTYLLWIDCREMGLTAKETEDFFVEEAAVAINPGNLFGEEGAGFVRLNIACPMDTVKKAMAQIQTAYNRKEVTQ